MCDVLLGVSAESYFSLLCRRLSISVLFFYGRWYLPIPYRVPITLVAAKSLTTTATEQPTKEQINEVNATHHSTTQRDPHYQLVAVSRRDG